MYLLERIKDGNDWKKGDRVWSDSKIPGWRVIESTNERKKEIEQKRNIIKGSGNVPFFFSHVLKSSVTVFCGLLV